MRIPLLITALALNLLPSVAGAGQTCADRTLVLERLAEAYGESRQAIGLGGNNAVVEVFASVETGTWTITLTFPDGRTCLIASGVAFERLNETLEPASEDT